MINVACKSLFKGNASVGSHIVEKAYEDKEDITITHKGKPMTIKWFMFGKFFEMGKRQYRHKNGLPGFYTLKYIKFEPDEKLSHSA